MEHVRSECSKEVRADVATARDRDPAARDVSTLGILSSWGGVQAILAHRVAHALPRRRLAVGSAGDRLRDPGADRHRDPSRRQDRRRLLHRPRLRRRDRRDGRDRLPRDHLPGRHARRHRLPARQAPPDGRGQRDDRLGREAARPDHGRPRRQGRAPTRSSSPTSPSTRRSSATRATSSASRAASPRAPTPTGSTFPTPSPTRSRPSPSASPRSSGASSPSTASRPRPRSASCARSRARDRRRLSDPAGLAARRPAQGPAGSRRIRR